MMFTEQVRSTNKPLHQTIHEKKDERITIESPTQAVSIQHERGNLLENNEIQKQSAASPVGNNKSRLNMSIRNFQEHLKKVVSFCRGIDKMGEEEELSKTESGGENMTPESLLRFFSSELSDIERNEISELRGRRVYYTGKSFGPNCSSGHAILPVDGVEIPFDDEMGDYRVAKHDHIAYRYQIINILGKGSFGQVVQVIDHKESQRVIAIKLLRNKRRFLKQGQTEVSILNSLQSYCHSNYPIVQMEDHFMFRGHLCIAFELLGMNLYEVIRQHRYQGFNTSIVRRFAIQILRALAALEERRIIHCDLKPENILLKKMHHSGIKVIDFGSSCFESERIYTYIQSRFYRAPEVILGMAYSTAIDMWSFACVLAELYTGKPLFPGEDESDQLFAIMEILGPVPRHILDMCSKKNVFFDPNGIPKNPSMAFDSTHQAGQFRRPASKTLSRALQCDDEEFLDLLYHCLTYDPSRRLGPRQALDHEWIKNVGVNSPEKIHRSQHTISGYLVLENPEMANQQALAQKNLPSLF